MNILLLFPAVLSALLLGVHFLRADLIPLAVVALLIPVFLFLRRAWAARLVQVIMVMGAFEWLRALVALVVERHTAGQPWGRLAVIMGLVAAFTGGSALLFSFSRSIRARYGMENDFSKENSRQGPE